MFRWYEDVCPPWVPLILAHLHYPRIPPLPTRLGLYAMAEPQIDPSLLDEGTSTAAGGRGVKRKTRNSESGVGAPAARVSTRLAGKTSSNMGVGVGIGVGKGGKSKGKGKETVGVTEVVEDEPSRGEEENLIGSEYKLRGVSLLSCPINYGRVSGEVKLTVRSETW